MSSLQSALLVVVCDSNRTRLSQPAATADDSYEFILMAVFAGYDDQWRQCGQLLFSTCDYDRITQCAIQIARSPFSTSSNRRSFLQLYFYCSICLCLLQYLLFMALLCSVHFFPHQCITQSAIMMEYEWCDPDCTLAYPMFSCYLFLVVPHSTYTEIIQLIANSCSHFSMSTS